ncbi:MAG: two-component system invasion response regulator UvrY, partial [Gammaproteobacteria bacterium]
MEQTQYTFLPLKIKETLTLIKLLLVDDHELVRTGIRRILEDVSDFEVVGEATNGEDAVKFCRNHAP